MCRFLKYSYSLLLCLSAFACSPVQKEEKPVEIPFTQDDLTQIYSLAFDTLLGSPTNWLPEEYEIGSDTLIVHVDYKLEQINEEFNAEVFSEERYYTSGRKLLKKYDGFDLNTIKTILADSLWRVYNYKAPRAIVSTFNYKPILGAKTKEAYYSVDTLGKVTFYKIAFNNIADYAIVTASFYKGPEWGIGYACFFRKENGRWRVVGKNRLYIS